MKNYFTLFLAALLLFNCHQISRVDKTLEPYLYTENFESNELNAWASYPPWQDTAFDPNIRPDNIDPADSNISLVEKVTPYTNVDNYAGAQKLMDAYLVPGSYIKLRYYLKTQLRPEFFKIRIAAGPGGKVDFTIPNPVRNKWAAVETSYDEFLRQNHGLPAGKIKVNAIAVLAKFPGADPAMPIYLAIDDVEFKGVRKTAFRFTEPEMLKLSEWKPFIPKKHFERGENFTLKGTWPVGADEVLLRVTSYTNPKDTVFTTKLNNNKEEWQTSFKVSFPEGLYLAELNAMKKGEEISNSQFTIFIKPNDITGKHPRLWFDKTNEQTVISRLKSSRFKTVKEKILATAGKVREENPVDSIAFDIDQFPGPDIDPTFGKENIVPWFERINIWRTGVFYNALAYHLLGEKEAGQYAVDLMVKISGFPFWLHPWWEGRGQHIYYPVGELGMDMAMGYDLLYEVMNDDERNAVRKALMKQIVKACHRSYVEDNLVTSNTSNWVAHITGGSLMCQAAMYGDDESLPVEPYFTGVILKSHDMIQKAFVSDGAYGEGYGYYNFTMLTLSKSLPAMDNVFHIDMSAKVNGSYKELIWAGNVKKKKTYYFGDSGGGLNPLTNWAWLLAKYKDPLLGWFYNYLKKDETLMDVLYETENVPQKNPFDEHPVKFFRDLGTTVFKSGWGKDDFTFVMRCGAFYNHQHMDQGSFWLSDHGSLFIEERHGSTYYQDPYYQPWYIQAVAHSTVLINHNHQSQRVGDPLVFAEGFDDHAFPYHFLDGSDAAFSSGDLGKLYWGKVKEIKRNVLYLKPRTLLMIDVITPGENNADVTELFQTRHLKDIYASKDGSTIKKDGNTLFIKHLYPETPEVKAVETPHYIYTLMNEKPLVKEGMLTVTAKTSGNPLVIANVLTSTRGEETDITWQKHKGFLSGTARGKDFMISTNPGTVYQSDNFITNALAVTWDDEKTFTAITTSLKRDGKLLIASDVPLTCEIKGHSIKYYHTEQADVTIGVESQPTSVKLNGTEVTGWTYNDGKLIVELPAGEGHLMID